MISVTSWAPNKAVQRDFTSRVQRTGCDFVAISYVSAHVGILNLNKLSNKLLCIHIYIYIYIYHKKKKKNKEKNKKLAKKKKNKKKTQKK
jgi:dipeptide/tripeptide permease